MYVSVMIKDIPGFEGKYAATEDGKIYSYRSNRFLTPWITKRGYHRISLSSNGISVLHPVHRLVAMAYVPNPNGLRFIHHKDTDKLNNHYKNLQWCTSRENVLLAIASGSHKVAKTRKFTPEQVASIRQLHRDGVHRKKIAETFGQAQGTVNSVIYRCTYAHLP